MPIENAVMKTIFKNILVYHKVEDFEMFCIIQILTALQLI